MEAKASVKTVRIAPRKVRLVIDLVRGKSLGEAVAILDHTNKAASIVVKKLIMSAAANAEHNYDLDMNKLYVKEIRCDEGSTMKRFQPRAQGRAFRILKRTSHINVTLAEKN